LSYRERIRGRGDVAEMGGSKTRSRPTVVMLAPRTEKRKDSIVDGGLARGVLHLTALTIRADSSSESRMCRQFLVVVIAFEEIGNGFWFSSLLSFGDLLDFRSYRLDLS